MLLEPVVVEWLCVKLVEMNRRACAIYCGHEACNYALHARYQSLHWEWGKEKEKRGRSSWDGRGREEEQRVRPSSKASRDVAASSDTSDDSNPPLGTGDVAQCKRDINAYHRWTSEKTDEKGEKIVSKVFPEPVKEVKHHLQTQLSGCFLLVTTRTFPEAREMGIAQHTIRGVDRFLLIGIFRSEWEKRRGKSRKGREREKKIAC